MIAHLRRDLRKMADKNKARVLQRFFKTGPGEYAEGDRFLGVVVPKQRALAKKYVSMSLDEVTGLLSSVIHEERLVALFIMEMRFSAGSDREQSRIFNVYLRNLEFVNNWDLVDLSAPKIVGPYLERSGREVLYKWASSKNMWHRRIAVLCTFHFLRKRDFVDVLRIAEILLHDEEDLIHKAVGWMLREVGKRDLRAEERFLGKFCGVMPRTMLRYAIERFPEEKRRFYLRRGV